MSILFDLHTHILPRIDDGSRSSDESISMLKELSEQGVSDVVATPHFYATEDEPTSFLQRRDSAASRLLSRIGEDVSSSESCIKLPRIHLGAEVAFFGAMSNAEVLKNMCISGTALLLVEMPFEKWTDAVIGELVGLGERQGITPIIAHIDRYLSYFDRHQLNELLSAGVRVQINADAFLRFSTRRRALELVESGIVNYIGSDCHNMGKRAPNIREALCEIKKKLGDDSLAFIEANARALLAQASPIFPRLSGEGEV